MSYTIFILLDVYDCIFWIIFNKEGMDNQMLRNVIRISEPLCTGCGLCTGACPHGAIIVSGLKAKLIRDEYCDGCGECTSVCPRSAVKMENVDTAPFNEAAARQRLAERISDDNPAVTNWPVQLQQVPLSAPYFNDCDLVIAADCTAFTHGDFRRFTTGRTLLIACTKLDSFDYSDRLSKILARNNVRSIHVIRMDVPCCGSFVVMVRKALELSGKNIPMVVTVISMKGKVNQ